MAWHVRLAVGLVIGENYGRGFDRERFIGGCFGDEQSFFRRWFSTPLVAGAREGNALLLQSSSRKCRNVNMKAASVSWWLSVAWHVRLAVGLAIGRERILAEFRVFMLSPFFCNFYWFYSFM